MELCFNIDAFLQVLKGLRSFHMYMHVWVLMFHDRVITRKIVNGDACVRLFTCLFCFIESFVLFYFAAIFLCQHSGRKYGYVLLILKMLEIYMQRDE